MVLCWIGVKCNPLLLFQSHLFSKVNIPDNGILTIDSSLPVNECAEDYTRKLKEVQRLFLFFDQFWLLSILHFNILQDINRIVQTHRPSQMTTSLCLTCYCWVWGLTDTPVPSSQSTPFWR